MPGMKRVFNAVMAVLIFCCLSVGATSNQSGRLRAHIPTEGNDDEFRLARIMYPTVGGGGSHGYYQPWWAIDYPLAEEHFLTALNRLTKVRAATDSWHLELTDDRIFEHPFLFLQQPGQGGWDPTPLEASRLREYLLRGGFLLVDDFHGEYDWAVMKDAMARVLPDREIIEIPDNDTIMHVFYDLTDRKQLPGERHLRIGPGGQTVVYMPGEVAHWRGIYDDKGRLMVAMNFNMDMGDSWEHADDPRYPAELTVQGYQLGVNYVLYSMTH